MIRSPNTRVFPLDALAERPKEAAIKALATIFIANPCASAPIGPTRDAYAAFLKAQPGVDPASIKVDITCRAADDASAAASASAATLLMSAPAKLLPLLAAAGEPALPATAGKATPPAVSATDATPSVPPPPGGVDVLDRNTSLHRGTTTSSNQTSSEQVASNTTRTLGVGNPSSSNSGRRLLQAAGSSLLEIRMEYQGTPAAAVSAIQSTQECCPVVGGCPSSSVCAAPGLKDAPITGGAGSLTSGDTGEHYWAAGSSRGKQAGDVRRTADLFRRRIHQMAHLPTSPNSPTHTVSRLPRWPVPKGGPRHWRH
jgi:hypothetical protein